MPERERIDTGTDKRYVRRDVKGHFTSDQTDVGRSSEADQRRHSETPAKRGKGDEGDRQTKMSSRLSRRGSTAPLRRGSPSWTLQRTFEALVIGF